MNGPDSNHPPQPTVDIPNAPSLQKLFLGCAVGCVLLVIVLAVFVAITSRAGYRYVLTADPVARQFLQAVQTGKSDDAYALCSDQWRRANSPTAFKELNKQWQTFTGQTESITLTGNSWSNEAGETRVNLDYNIHGSKHPMLVDMVLISSGESYKVLSYRYQKGPDY